MDTETTKQFIGHFQDADGGKTQQEFMAKDVEDATKKAVEFAITHHLQFRSIEEDLF
jgi:capsule polysaccharide export protein KpsC/LpsZ